MDHKHLDAAALDRLLAVDRSVEQNEQLFYLLASCPVCREAGGWLLELHQAQALPPVFGLIDAALARSRAEAPQLLKELAALDPEARPAHLLGNPRFVSWGLCELLVRESRRTAPESASEAVRLADLAVHLADALQEGEPFEEKWIYQLRSLSWAALGNAYKVQGDLASAERSFEMSDSWWEAGAEGVGDALGYEPVLLVLKAPLRLSQRRFAEAIKLLEQAVDLYLEGQPEHRDPHLAGRTMISKATVFIEMGDSETAIETLKRADGLIDPEHDPRLVLCIRHNLADTLSKTGHHQEASALLPGLKELAATHGRATDLLRLDWVEGRIAAGLGDHDQARRLLTRVRQTFLDEDNAFDAALAALDLAISHLQEGKTAEVRDLADEMVTVFQSLQVSREPMAALLLFQEAARRETATAELAREVAAALTRARGGAPGAP